eukprot:SAG31_NODE_6170_length_2139_cov_1.609804_2_plen_77_part_00
MVRGSAAQQQPAAQGFCWDVQRGDAAHSRHRAASGRAVRPAVRVRGGAGTHRSPPWRANEPFRKKLQLGLIGINWD